MTYLEKLERAIVGLELIRRSLPGTGPTTERIDNRKRGKELMMPWLKHRNVPEKYREASEKIMNEVCNLN